VESAPPSQVDAAQVRCKPALAKLRALGPDSWEGLRHYDQMPAECRALADGRPLRPAAPPPHRRSEPKCIGSCGWFFGIGMGIGGMGVHGLDRRGDWDGANASSGLATRVGRTIRPRWDLGVEFDGAGVDNDIDLIFESPSDSSSQASVGPLIQYWIAPGSFARGSLVLSALTLEDRDGERYTSFGPGFSGAMGFRYGASEYSLRIAAARYATDGGSSLSGDPWLVHIWFMFGFAR
jgi:hypothetical protein